MFQMGGEKNHQLENGWFRFRFSSFTFVEMVPFSRGGIPSLSGGKDGEGFQDVCCLSWGRFIGFWMNVPATIHPILVCIHTVDGSEIPNNQLEQ